MENKDRTANSGEMRVNQEAYNNATANNDIIVVDDSGAYTHTGEGDSKRDVIFDEIPDSAKTVLYRTDVDEYNTKYKTSDLQNHNTGSGLDITTYSAYSGFKEPNKEPEKVIVGVAGTDGVQDWGQNLHPEIGRSSYNNDSDEKLKNELHNFRMDHAEIKYELEIRQKVRALKKYRDNGVPISIVGDSKGAEDGAYLALNVVKSTQVELVPGVKSYDYSAVNVYLTNPKGIRVSDDDYKILEEMAQAGKVTVEVVYPEIVGNIAGDRLPRAIPYSRKLFTVPNALKGSISNHQIGGYESKVYQGFGGNYKFQCDEEPTAISEMQWVEEPGLTIGSPSKKVWKSVGVGYRYAVAHVTDKAGKTMSVNDYFFEEQIEKMKHLRDEMDRRAEAYRNTSSEPILEYFTSEVDNKSYSLMTKHEKWMRGSTPFETYYEEYKERIQTQDATRYSLERDYELELEKQSYNEGGKYKNMVKTVLKIILRRIKSELKQSHSV